MPFQRGEVDNALRQKLWNILSVAIWDQWHSANQWRSQTNEAIQVQVMTKRLWIHFFNEDLDNLPAFKSEYGKGGAYGVMKDFFFKCPWYHVYSFLEEIAEDQSKLCTPKVRDWINEELQHHNAAHRFVGTKIVEITSEHEISAIQSAQESAPNPVREHLQAALRMLSDREKPDYRNSIKESISAVESACRIATGNPKANLSDALKRIPNLHPALATGFDKLYGYTSDASGIRHSLTDVPTHTYDEAKFMLVACSAFTSYLQGSAKP